MKEVLNVGRISWGGEIYDDIEEGTLDILESWKDKEGAYMRLN